MNGMNGMSDGLCGDIVLYLSPPSPSDRGWVGAGTIQARASRPPWLAKGRRSDRKLVAASIRMSFIHIPFVPSSSCDVQKSSDKIWVPSQNYRKQWKSSRDRRKSMQLHASVHLACFLVHISHALSI